ncbi:T9SS type A sorting domain-containing protein [Hymenobacter negativus]|uniref:T9SS type A sorting domain-containing protein n=1 Tax=Hymenobacter negativus TaxID=2795026 RepID=A0ABS0Q9R4_9BACT|nr:T9SS type A sorting domain-containing protein [Hymenobacter negativus]MBH8559365.1 T9SS type A sorting domain-containing protein [Hymenobacter negativus]
MTYPFSLPGLLMKRQAPAAGRATRAGRAVLLVLLLALPLLSRAQSSTNIVTLNASAITTISATLGCHINNPGSLTTQGVAYALGSVTPLVTGNSVSSSVTPGVDAYYSVSNLLPGRHYSMRAFSIDSQGNVEYGPFNGFDTPPLAYQPQGPVVTVTPAASTLSPGGTQTLTASTTLPGFNLAGASFNGEVFAVQLQPDGKVLVGGNFTSLNDRAAPAYLLRLNADGTLDTGFSPGQNGLNGKVYSLVLQPDGKVLVGGEFTAPRNRVLRVNADGSLDPNFNPGGAGANDFVRILALQPDGKVLVGGNFSTYNGSGPGRLTRLLADGTLDTGFNPGGAGASALVTVLLVQPDGLVLVGGQFTSYNGGGPARLTRLLANGLPDPTFNPGGAGATSPGSTDASPMQALVLLADGRILAGGRLTAYNGDASVPDGLLRLLANGLPDPTFNPGGTGLNAGVRALVQQPDGKVLVGGLTFTTYNGNANAPDGLLRLNADGTLDTGFNNGSPRGVNASVYALALQPDGKVLVGGLFTTYNGSAVAPRYLMRVNPDGSLETTVTATAALDGVTYTWNTGATGPTLTVSQPGDYLVKATTARQGMGYSTVVRVSAPPATAVRLTPPGPLALPAGGSATLTATATQPGFNVSGSGFNNDVRAVVVQPDGKVLVGGLFSTYNGNASAPDFLVRLLPDGSLDPTFNPGGTGPSGGSPYFSGGVYALALQPDGKVLVGGRFSAYNGDNNAPDYLLRVNADGTLDTGFNYGPNTGFVHPLVDDNGVVYALALQPDGKVVAGGRFEVFNGSSCPHHVARVNADGSLDVNFNFNGSGIRDDSFYSSDGLGRVEALLLLPNGKIMVGGVFTDYDDDNRAPNGLLRLNPEGDIDRQFNYNQYNFTTRNDGSGLAGPYDQNKGAAYTLALQPDGKVLVGGNFDAWLISPFQSQAFGNVHNLMRLNTDNTVDGTFNPQSHGVGAENAVYALAVQPDGKALVGGAFTSYNGTPRNFLMRVEANGTLNNADSFTGINSPALALAVQPDGKVLVGGTFVNFNGSSTSSRLIRLQPDGTLNNADAPLAGATFAFNPGNVSGSTYTVRTPGTYTATATDPATGFAYPSNAVTVTFAPLPVELTAFTATLAGPAVRLAWATASEKNSQAFIVERSLDGQSFAAIGTVAAAGSSTSARAYELLDAKLPSGVATLYYRLKQVDADGTFSYSPVRTVALTAAATGLALFPNPAQGGAVTLMGAQAGTAVTVFDALGRPVLAAATDAAGTAALALPAGLATGVYVVRVGSKALRLTVQ